MKIKDLKVNVIPKEYIYINKLSHVNGIQFTQREIDLISCITNGRTSKKIIAETLNISPRTVESHTRNITKKIHIHSWEEIRKFSEKNNIISFLREYYDALMIDIEFLKILKKISFIKHKRSCILKIEHQEIIPFCEKIKNYLTLAGIKTLVKNQNDSLPDDKENQYEIINFNIFIKKNEQKAHDKNKFLNPYLIVISILKRITNENDLDEIIKKFSLYCDSINESHNIHKIESHKETRLLNFANLVDQKRKIIIFFFFLFICIFSSIFIWNRQYIEKIHSELSIPDQKTLLKRSHLIKRIHTFLIKSNKTLEISHISISGVVGSGKTTLARIVGQNHEGNLVWEINAKTLSDIKKSFNALAYALAISDSEKKALKDINTIPKKDDKELQILNFVQKKLKKTNNWLLIYDNMSSITELKHYFPKTSMIWGNGSVIITTNNQNITIDNNIYVDALTHEESYELISRILFKENKPGNEELKLFLKKIPPFPLDISIAGNYILNTKISFSEYLSRLKENKFQITQGSIMGDIMEHAQTRKQIVHLTIHKILEENKNFEPLMILISLIDSKNIPRSLLESTTNKMITDQFLYVLKKNSLIVSESFIDKNYTFSLHDIIHDIISDYMTTLIGTSPNTTIRNIINHLDKIILDEESVQMKIIHPHIKKIITKTENIPSENALIKCKLAILETHLGIDTLTIIKDINESLSQLRKNFDENKIHIAQGLVYLGDAHKRLGNYLLAIPILEESIKIYKSLKTIQLGEAQAITYLGTIYRIQGHYDKSKELLTKSRDIYKKLPKEHISEAQNSIYLGLVYRDLGEYSLALKSINEGISYFEKHGNDPMWVSWGSAYLAQTINDMGEYSKAEKIIKKNLELRKKNINSEIWQAWGETILGQSYLGLEKIKLAKDTLENCRSVYEKKHQNNYVYFNVLLVLLGESLLKMNMAKDARDILEKSLLLSENHYGEKHIQTADIINKIGQSYFMEGNDDKAEHLMNKALEIFEKTNHIDRYKTFENLYILFTKKALFSAQRKELSLSKIHQEKAFLYISKAYEIMKNHFPQESIHYKRIKKLFDESSSFSINNFV